VGGGSLMATKVVFWDARRGVAVLQNQATGRTTRFSNMTDERLAKLVERVAYEEARREQAGLRSTELFSFSSTPDGITHR
jgi:hypothetical protein